MNSMQFLELTGLNCKREKLLKNKRGKVLKKTAGITRIRQHGTNILFGNLENNCAEEWLMKMLAINALLVDPSPYCTVPKLVCQEPQSRAANEDARGACVAAAAAAAAAAATAAAVAGQQNGSFSRPARAGTPGVVPRTLVTQ